MDRNELKKKVIDAMDLLDLEVVSIREAPYDETGKELPALAGLVVLVTPSVKKSL